jgi:hypothetical protein
VKKKETKINSIKGTQVHEVSTGVISLKRRLE